MFVCTFWKIQEIIKKKTAVSSHPSIPVCHLSTSPASVWVIGVCVCVCVCVCTTQDLTDLLFTNLSLAFPLLFI